MRRAKPPPPRGPFLGEVTEWSLEEEEEPENRPLARTGGLLREAPGWARAPGGQGRHIPASQEQEGDACCFLEHCSSDGEQLSRVSSYVNDHQQCTGPTRCINQA